MFNLTTGTAFVQQLFQTIWKSSCYEKILQFYHADVIGHYQGTNFNLADIKNRLQSLNDVSDQRDFIFKDMVIIDELITFYMTQAWRIKKTGQLSTQDIVGIYRIKNQKIQEVWIMSEQTVGSYQTTTQKISQYMQLHLQNNKNKSDFVEAMKTLLQMNSSYQVNLKPLEYDCLYYYLNGYTAKELGEILHVSPRTAEGYFNDIKAKFFCSSRHQLRRLLLGLD